MSNPVMVDALYKIASMRLFAGLALNKPIPDHTTIMNFRHVLERHDLARQMFENVSACLTEAGIIVKKGTLMDATIIEAPSSTKKKAGERNPEMHQTKKDNQWYFGGAT